MAENQTAEDDDEEGFGDFTFAAPAAVPPPTNIKINGGGPDLSFNNLKINGGGNYDDDNDDDWGDFVTFPTVSQSQSMKAKPFDDPFSFVSDPAPNPVESKWVKPGGALPLSLFGEVEEEEEEEKVSGVAGLQVFSGPAELKTNKDAKQKRGSELNVSDLVLDLLKQSQQSKVSNGSGLNLENSSSRGMNLDLNGLNSDSNGLNSENLSSRGMNLDLNGLNSDSNGLNWDNSSSRGLNLDLNGLNSDSNGLNSGSDGDFSWEFKGSEPKLAAGDFNFKTDHLVKTGNGPASDFSVFNLSRNVLGSDLNGLSSKPSGVNQMSLNFNGVVLDTNGLSSNFNGVNLDANRLSSNFNGVNADANGSCLVDDNENFGDDDEWEFQDAKSEMQLENSNSKVNSKEPENFVGNGVHDPTNLFVASDGISQKSGELDFGFEFNKSSVTQDVTNCNSYSSSMQKNDNENGLNATPINGHVNNGENFWEFKDAFTETGSKDNKFNDNENGLNSTLVNGQVNNGENVWEFKDAFSETGSNDKGNEVKIENHKGALPLSFFGDEELQTGDHLNPQDVSTHSPTSTVKDIKTSHRSTISLNDLISNLYNQTEQNTSVNHTRSKSENALDSMHEVVDSNLVVSDDDFDDDSWEFKGSFSGSIAINQTSVPNHGDSHITYSTKVEPKDYADFYAKLNHELCFVSQFHFDSLKNARSTAALCGKDAEVKALDGEIQDLYNELHQDSIMSKEAHSENRSPNNIRLNEFVEVLREPKFHVLESEYHLSKQLSSAEKDWRSAIELLKHAASTSKILNLGSREDQSNYVSTWFKMLSVCAQELRHGALIWKQSLEQNVHSQILSHPQGKQYILALGEIYRLVEVLGCSVKVYKPWVLLNSTDPSGMFTLLSECSTLWSSSGLEEAFRNISETAGSEYNGTPKDLIESVKCIHNLDVLALHSHVFSGEEPTCGISALTAGTVPGMKLVVWNEQHYFVTLANLWANLIRSDPPNLPQIVG
ncbi:hypothetical protein EZV62_006809 [Acer yangbiense]|uniref:Synergin gamma C-terminal domain-containing protein n=1 Tax=Acer yangbiense TaxID=1000413 RepID=A0A5C7I8R7_9ROSI|nr:hypothetical protein EZV62_006809 [Acer yangbiense]